MATAMATLAVRFPELVILMAPFPLLAAVPAVIRPLRAFKVAAWGLRRPLLPAQLPRLLHGHGPTRGRAPAGARPDPSHGRSATRGHPVLRRGVGCAPRRRRGIDLTAH
ncbi:hypothetical protein Asi02nite_80800 [Asanoa siamensis]|uniref:Uncharacterized protein n=1 Tax=Asanoa siamensis TaxID=926357 RepID=A0ABQ4D616_9ACTN|nr:hypothetical protein Asi02nite_80800 [Asanoa siamensis]